MKLKLCAMTLAMIAMMIPSIKTESKEPELHKARATAYCLKGITSTGKKVRDGICAAGKDEWVGKTLILYQRLPNGKIGSLIGIYEVEDTGCKSNVIDVWRPEDECQSFMNKVYEDECQGKVYVQVVDAVG